MKKMAALILAVMMGATALACISGCSNNYGLNPSEPVTLTYWHCYTGLQRQEMEAAVLDFNETVGRKRASSSIPTVRERSRISPRGCSP